MSRKSIVRLSLATAGVLAILAGGYSLNAWQGAPVQTASSDGAAASGVTRALATGALTAFVVHSEPKPVPDVAFEDAAGEPLSIAQWRGRVALVNLWATWCGPCREEMPALAELQKQLGSDEFEVVAISTDRQGAEVARPFLEKVGAEALTLYLDPTTKVVNEFKAVGLPATILIDRSGHEIGRMMGPAEWDSPEAVRLIEAAIGEAGSS